MSPVCGIILFYLNFCFFVIVNVVLILILILTLIINKTLYFKNQSLDLTLSDIPAGKSEYVQIYPAGATSSVFEDQSLTNSGKALGIVWTFAHGRSLGLSDIPSGLRPSGKSDFPFFFLGTSIWQIFQDNPCDFSTVCPRVSERWKLGNIVPIQIYPPPPYPRGWYTFTKV